MPEDVGASTSANGSGMTVNITVSASGLPTATLSSFGQNYKIGDVVVFDPPNGTGTPIRVQVADVPELIQNNVPVNYSSWTPSKNYTGVAPVATSSAPDCMASSGVTCTSAGTGMTVDITVDQYGQPIATIDQTGIGYALGDEMFFDPPDGVGTPLEVQLQPVLLQSQLPSGFLPWTPLQNYTQVDMSSTSGAGTGMTARVTVDASGIPTLSLGAVIGTGYAVGDTVTFDPPDGIGDPINATIISAPVVLTQSVLPLGFVPWTPSQNYTQLAMLGTSGEGSGMTASVAVDSNGIPTLTVGPVLGTGYSIGDTFTFDPPDGIGSPITATITATEYAQQVNVNWLPNQTWDDVSASTESGTGTGLTVDITTDSQGTPQITLVDPGTGYHPGMRSCSTRSPRSG